MITEPSINNDAKGSQRRKALYLYPERGAVFQPSSNYEALGSSPRFISEIEFQDREREGPSVQFPEVAPWEVRGLKKKLSEAECYGGATRCPPPREICALCRKKGSGERDHQMSAPPPAEWDGHFVMLG